MKRLPPLNTLRIFESAARNVSFADAAEELYLTPSAVSHQIKTLESHLGVALFLRNRRKVELSPVGEKYYISVRQALNELEVATQRVMATQETDVVTISVAPNFLMRWLMPRMNRFQDLYPDVELQITASTEVIDFERASVDMAVYFGHGDWHDVDMLFLNRVYLTPAYSPRLLHNARALREPEDLRGHTLIHVSKRLHEWPEWLEKAGVAYRGFGRGLRLSSSQLATAAAEEGLGIALADTTLSSREIEKGLLVMPFDIQLDTQKSLYLVNRKGRTMSHGMTAFRDWVVQEMGG